MRRLRIKSFEAEKEKKCREYAAAFTKGRAHNGLSPLEVERDEATGEWWVVNADIDEVAREGELQPWRPGDPG